MAENISKPRVVFLKTPDPKGLNSWIIEGIEKSISANGFETKIIDISDPNTVAEKVNEIIDFKPLFMFDTNLDGVIFGEREGTRQPLCDIIGNIHITWFIDDPMIHFSKLKPVLNSNQFLYITVDVEHSQWIASAGKNVVIVPPGTNPSKIPPLMDKDFEVAFIGPITEPSIIESNWRERFDDALFGFAVELGRLIYRNPDMPIRFASGYLLSQLNPDFQNALLNFQRENEEDFMNLLTEIGLYAMNIRRWNILTAVENFEVNVLGPVMGEPPENVVVHEDVFLQKDIVEFLARTKVSLLSQPPFIPTSLGFTVFDSVASGALSMVEERLSSKSFFTPEKEIVLYHPMDPVEIEGKIAYYLEDNPQEREEIAKAGREKAIKEHNIYSRGEIIASIMKDIIKQSLAEEKPQEEQQH